MVALNRSALVLIFLILSLSLTAPIRAQTTIGGNYQIGAGDVLEIVTWKEPDLSRAEILVRIDGYISFPLLNDILAAGLTATQLTQNIQEGLKEFISKYFYRIG